MKKKFPSYIQLDVMDCGATCLKILSKYYEKEIAIEKLRDRCYTDREGVSILGISDAAESIGFRSLCARISFENLKDAPMPFVAFWRERHFLIVYKIKNDQVYCSDPAHGRIVYSRKDFEDAWINATKNEDPEGYALFMEPTPAFYEQEEEDLKERRKKGLMHYAKYLRPYKKYYVQILFSLVIATIIQVVFPFLTQALVDIGVSNHDLDFINIILIAQIVLFLSQTAGQFVRSWLFLHMSARINISILSDFIVKLMKLPISYFERKTPGDIMTRIYDHDRIQGFFTTQILEFTFTIISIVVFGTILATYNTIIFITFSTGSILYFVWIIFFMKLRKELDYKTFDQTILNQNKTIQLVAGMQEIKLQNCEKQKRWEWERIQVTFFKLGIKSLVIQQFEQGGSTFMNGIKDLLLTFYAATLVVEGEMTIGMMIAVQFITGQLNSQIGGILSFLHSRQDALISVDRLAEIHKMEEEETSNDLTNTIGKEKHDIVFNNVSFQYGGPRSEMVVKNFNLTIPKGKTTAIVGASGSGKSTLLKLLLKSYEPIEGAINYGEHDIKTISFKTWRNKFATVTQDSFIFSDKISRNIAIGEEFVDKERIRFATNTANIREFIEKLPMTYNTKIGEDGIGVSQGQKQRILLARAVYKNSDILMLDEATNALDANNEKKIVNNLNEYCKGKTVVVVAHRLSTVRNADQIIVLGAGEIREKGTHDQLVALKGEYYDLVKNQLSID